VTTSVATATTGRWAEIDLGAVRENVRQLLHRLPVGCRLIAVVKADAYGHGARPVATAVLEAGAWGLAVSTPEEALSLVDLCGGERLLIMGGLAPATCEAAVRVGCAVVCSAPWMVEALEALVPAGRRLPVHLEIDTGLHRLGCTEEEAPRLASRIAGSGRLRLVGTMTHFASSDSDPRFTRLQLERFLETLSRFDVDPGIRHAANSWAILRHPEAALDAVRPGIALYGCAGQLRPALTLRALVTQVREVRSGHSVGYGRTWTAWRTARIATVAIGYEDGVMRSRSNRGQVVVRGVRAPLVGRVSMDSITIDVSDVPEVEPGDPVTVIGDGITAEEVAAWSGTIPYEVLTALGNRVARVYLGAMGQAASTGDRAGRPQE